jgi:hypothetical protein
MTVTASRVISVLLNRRGTLPSNARGAGLSNIDSDTTHSPADITPEGVASSRAFSPCSRAITRAGSPGGRRHRGPGDELLLIAPAEETAAFRAEVWALRQRTGFTPRVDGRGSRRTGHGRAGRRRARDPPRRGRTSEIQTAGVIYRPLRPRSQRIELVPAWLNRGLRGSRVPRDSGARAGGSCLRTRQPHDG